MNSFDHPLFPWALYRITLFHVLSLSSSFSPCALALADNFLCPSLLHPRLAKHLYPPDRLDPHLPLHPFPHILTRLPLSRPCRIQTSLQGRFRPLYHSTVGGYHTRGQGLDGEERQAFGVDQRGRRDKVVVPGSGEAESLENEVPQVSVDGICVGKRSFGRMEMAYHPLVPVLVDATRIVVK